MQEGSRWDRRQAITLAFGAAGLALIPSAGQAAVKEVRPHFLPAQRSWTAVPPQVPVTEGKAPLPGVKLYYWDTGGTGEPILLCHPATGSALVWGYQQPVFARAGYRVIGYSRRGAAGSETGPPDNPGHAVDDIQGLLNHLKVDKFHMVASAGGGFSASDYAQSYPERLLSMVISCSFGGVTEKSFRERMTTSNPPGFLALPASFRELGPFYRAAYPQGVAEWTRLEEHSRSGEKIVFQQARNRLDFADLEKNRVPTLVVAGASDLTTPVSMMLEFASHLPNSEVVIISDCGHSAYWEQPDAFNATVLDFIGRHRQLRVSSTSRAGLL